MEQLPILNLTNLLAVAPQDPVESAPVAPGGSASAGPAAGGGMDSGQTLANGSGQVKGQGGFGDACAGGGTLPMLLLFGGVFYFLLMRPQQKQEKKLRELRSGLQRGDRVVTSAGLHGVIESVQEHTLTLLVDGQIRLTFDKSAIQRTVSDELATGSDAAKT